MKPEQLLVATASGDAILINGLRANTMHVIGTTMPMSAKPGDNVHSVALYPAVALYPEEWNGIVALSVFTDEFKEGAGRHQRGVRVPFFLEVKGSFDPKLIELSQSWIPPRPGQVYDTHLEVQIGDQRFTSQAPHAYTPRGLRYVPDPNLLCRYLIGEATEDEVRAAAAEYVEEVSAREQLAGTLKLLEEGRQKFAELDQRFGRFGAELKREANLRGAAVDRVWFWHTAAKALERAAKQQRFKGSALQAALRSFPQEDAFPVDFNLIK